MRLLLSLPGLLLASTALGQTVLSQSFTTPAGAADQIALCTGTQAYPSPWEWSANQTPMPAPAVSGTPRIDQVRNGVVIATYSSLVNQPSCSYLEGGQDAINPAPAAASGCGPFQYSHNIQLMQDDDTFNIYPAFYSGIYNESLYLGPQWIGTCTPDGCPTYTPRDIHIHGLVQGGFMPSINLASGASYEALNQAVLYVDTSTAPKIDHLAILGSGAVIVGNAGVFLNAGSDITLAWMIVEGFGPNPAMTGGANGIITSNLLTGTLAMRHMQLAFNGGDNGPRHNAYIAASSVDPAFKVVLSHSYLHDVVEGHLFKTRAQSSTIAYDYFRGGLPQPGQTMAETYDLDLSNGGDAKVFGNIFAKDASGDNSNGMSVSYALEGLLNDGRVNAIDFENNTFVALSHYFDDQQHPLYPISMFYPQSAPTLASWPGIPATIRNNVFAGYCPTGNAAYDYRGDVALTVGLSEIGLDYTLATDYESATSNAPGRSQYAHVSMTGATRTLNTLGARGP